MPESSPKYAIQNGEITEVDPKDVEYEFYSFNNFHGLNANAIPLMTAVQAPRINYGQRFMTQAMPLADPDEPLVQSKLPDSNQSFDQSFGRSLGAVFNDSFDSAVVQAVTPEEIRLKGDNGETKSISLYRNYPFNRKSMVTNTPLVQPGQSVKKGQILAKSNFTNDKGNFALGKNLRVGIVPYRGYSMDDAIVVSQSAANKLTSVHTYTKELQEDGDNLRIDRDQFVSMFPTKFTKDQLDKLDEKGLPKVGTLIEKGDPLILATRPKTISSKSMDLSNLSRVNRVLRTDASEIWDHEDPAEVLDTVITKDGVRKVILSSKSPAKVGDKIAMRSGQKDIISKIIPDDKMLRGEDGKPLEILLNPQSLPSRANTALVYEILGGKIAEKLGKKLVVPAVPPPGTKWFDVFGDLLHKNGLNDTETVYDPVRDKNLSNPITVGNAYVMKLHHVVESKFSSRNQGGYDCYSEDTEVLTSEGWKLWPDVKESDKLATLSNEGRFIFETPENLVSYRVDGELVSVKSKFIDLLTTDNHKHIIRTLKNKEWRKVEASKLPSRFELLQFGILPYKPENIQSHIQVPDFTFTKQVRTHEYKGRDIPEVPFMYLMGLWCADGSIQTEEHGRWSVTWNQSTASNPELCSKIEDMMEKCGLKFRLFRRDTGMNAYGISDPALARWIENNFGKDSFTKKIPSFLFSCSLEARKAFISGYLEGDGYETQRVHGSRKKVNHIVTSSTASKELADGLQALAVISGYGVVVSTYHIDQKFDGCTCQHPMYRVGFHLKRTAATFRTQGSRYSGSIKTVEYHGNVYCATMPTTGVLYVRRNGKPVLSGNSNEQPTKGGKDGSKRFSGLEVNAMLSSGAYANLREGATIRGQRNDEYWRAIREGRTPQEPGTPFVFRKFLAMLTGSGMFAKEVGDGKLRLGPLTDRLMEQHKPIEVQNSGMVDLGTLRPKKGGLFSDELTGTNAWGKITLKEPLPNPAFEPQIMSLLDLKKADLRAILAGEMELPSHVLERLRKTDQ